MRKRYHVKKRGRRRKAKVRFFVLIGVAAAALAVGIYFIVVSIVNSPGTDEPPSANVTMTAPTQSEVAEVVTPTPTNPPTPSPPPTPTPEPTLAADLKPHQTESTNPENFGFVVNIMNNGVEVDTYSSGADVTFDLGEEYTVLEGVTTFRGNNYRDAASFGTAEVANGTLTVINEKTTGRIESWGGSGWTGQPLVVKWTGKTLQNMDGMFLDEFKGKDELIEVIIASLDGNIYFMELATGKKTRDPIYSGGPTKGTPSLDPRGYPILYVGQGLEPDGIVKTGKEVYFRAFSLIDGERIMKVGASSSDPFALRKSWQAYDSSPLIDAETDTLIWPGENGIIYICKLNTKYDETAGTLSMDMEPIKAKYRYTSIRNTATDRWGIENSIVTWRNYMIFTDNAGMLQCVDLNTLELIYANDLSDDSDVSMVLEEDVDAATFYLYTGCEYDELVRPLGNTGPAYARKLDGLTGEIVWEQSFTVFANENVDGGVLASPVLGREGTTMEGLVIFNVTYEEKGDSTTSKLVALDKLTGTLVWEYDMEVTGWSPSSPVPVYTQDGKGYIVQCDRDGDVALIDGATGVAVKVLSLKKTGSDGKVTEQNNFEAAPVVYNNMIVVGSRNDHFFFIEIG